MNTFLVLTILETTAPADAIIPVPSEIGMMVPRKIQAGARVIVNVPPQAAATNVAEVVLKRLMNQGVAKVILRGRECAVTIEALAPRLTKILEEKPTRGRPKYL